MTERRWDPALREWQTVRGRSPVLPEPGSCRFCPTRPGLPPTEVPRAAYELAVLDDPSLWGEVPESSVPGTALQPVEPARGAAEVVLWSDRHDLALAQADVTRLARLVDVWADRYAVLGARDENAYVLVSVADDGGSAADHPHGRVSGCPDVPARPRKELEAGLAHLTEHGTCVWCDVVAAERSDGARVVAEQEHLTAYVPFAARSPYELHLVTLRHATSLLDLTDPERASLARLLKTVTSGMAALLGATPYALVVHQAPTDDGPWLAVAHLHLEITPLRRQDRSGLCLLGGPAPEDAAEQLRAAIARTPS